MMLNIDEVRRQKKVTLVDMGDLLGVKYQTISEKIDGKSDFKFGEALIIQENFFPEYELKFLFSKKKQEA
ncbi:transcriptional regulator [Vagococcus salmoninarum]|uniref:Transcriptional regulator n=2 Tax=Vagococcus salmoninarum TaxID=2739 RepID=A0A429ZSL6_9ENTE|nr:XRE family transcriptional regulator [Vagococcus salmoninarum]RST96628.1 transcriptional regulator [Vagococcus salmoninarum]